MARLEGLGARRAPRQDEGGDDRIVMADSDGNEVCVVPSAYAQDERETVGISGQKTA